MQYRSAPRIAENLSALGYGCMRFPRHGGGIDQALVNAQVARALELGVNYFDTAYIYPGNEAALGTALQTLGARDKVYVADKLPHYLLKTEADLDRYFDAQLARLKTDHIDYYLLHMLPDPDAWARLQGLGIEAFLQKKRDAGQIRRIGFSYHGSTDTFLRLCDLWDWAFCQIQYNYVDQTSQAGERGLRYASDKGMAVMIMEPLRGGRLADSLPRAGKAAFEAENPALSPAQWGLQWLLTQKEVTVVLSGMNQDAQLTENAAIASDTLPRALTPGEAAAYQKARDAVNHGVRVPCTACGYCQPCPRGVDIPGCFSAYNTRYASGYYLGIKQYFMCTTLRAAPANASLCVGCGKCEAHCPQGLPIRKYLRDVRAKMEDPIYRMGRFIARKRFQFDK